MSDLNNCNFTGTLDNIKEVRDLGSSKVRNFSLNCQKKLQDGRVISTWPRFEAWGGWSDAMDTMKEGDPVFIVAEYQVRKGKDNDEYYHSFTVKTIGSLGVEEATVL